MGYLNGYYLGWKNRLDVLYGCVWLYSTVFGHKSFGGNTMRDFPIFFPWAWHAVRLCSWAAGWSLAATVQW
jgi:hypothetical protein